ncbi:ThuA domain-containing protein [Flavivirga algicola]|uniref:ThuA domain-containing protein n=1 Tax=Flavivirga algicola TaxID=2729136 RepID=A0ABX1S1J2_9FLAO|nr:ThuA domain-containing protein [Flavivirga algicola]NMH89742.1 ThuA domain-containing protein [Flavivirga algicola]
MKKNIVLVCLAIFTLSNNFIKAQNLSELDLTEDWLAKIEKLAPSKPRIQTNFKKQILVFSLHTGFEHWTIPHTEAIIKLLGDKSNAFEVTISYSISSFEKKNLKKYDAIVLNNNCSDRAKRNLFWDALANASLSDKKRLKKAEELENNLLQYVKKGHGLMVLHGAIVMQNKSESFGNMVGGSFDYHPKQQEIEVNLVDPKHPLVQAFNGQGFTHIDEPYFFKNAYFNYNFHPLLYMNTEKLDGLRSKPKDHIKYISWIKKHGKGNVFYCSPSHNAQSYENPKLLQYLLDGMQYITGDLLCDDSPNMERYP